MKKLILLLAMLFMAASGYATDNRVFYFNTLTGGAEGALDAINATDADGDGEANDPLITNDIALGVDGTTFRAYLYNSTNSSAESSPDYIVSDAQEGGTGGWEQVSSSGSGEVSISGTPSDNEFAIWTASDTIEGKDSVSVTIEVGSVQTNSTDTLDANATKNVYIYNTGQSGDMTTTLSECAGGEGFIAYVTETGHDWNFDCNANDKYRLAGTWLDDGDQINCTDIEYGDTFTILPVPDESGTTWGNWIFMQDGDNNATCTDGG